MKLFIEAEFAKSMAEKEKIPTWGWKKIKNRQVVIPCVLLLLSVNVMVVMLKNRVIGVFGDKTSLKLTALPARIETQTFSSCSSETMHHLINSLLPISLHDNVDVTALELSGCFAIDNKKSGLYRIVHERNFAQVICNTTQKKFFPAHTKEIPTALASIPGSGNTWVRHLMEELTGIYTGSIYGSRLLDQVFKGEHTTHNVVAIKTHQLFGTKRGIKFERAILIVRDLFDFKLAEYNRSKMKNKTKILSKAQFNKEAFRSKIVHSTRENNACVKWIEKFNGDMFVIFYNNLKTDLLNSLTKLAAFCQSEVNLKTLWCTLNNQEGYFHRGEKPKWMSRGSLLDDRLKKIVSTWMEDVKMAIKNRTANIATNL